MSKQPEYYRKSQDVPHEIQIQNNSNCIEIKKKKNQEEKNRKFGTY